jgi:hypothetical protein
MAETRENEAPRFTLAASTSPNIFGFVYPADSVFFKALRHIIPGDNEIRDWE